MRMPHIFGHVTLYKRCEESIRGFIVLQGGQRGAGTSQDGVEEPRHTGVFGFGAVLKARSNPLRCQRRQSISLSMPAGEGQIWEQ